MYLLSFYRPCQRWNERKRKGSTAAAAESAQVLANQQAVAKNLNGLIDVVKRKHLSASPGDDCEKFLAYLGTKLRKFPTEKRLKLERKVLNLVEDEIDD